MSKILIDRSAVEQALTTLEGWGNYDKWVWPESALFTAKKNTAEMITALRAALEQPQVEQEPAAWIERWYGSGPERGWWIVCGRDHIAHLGPAEMSGEAASKIVSAHNTSPPAQRKPLTDAQINDHRLALAYDSEDLPDPWDFKQGVRAAERAHGIGGEK